MIMLTSNILRFILFQVTLNRKCEHEQGNVQDDDIERYHYQFL